MHTTTPPTPPGGNAFNELQRQMELTRQKLEEIQNRSQQNFTEATLSRNELLEKYGFGHKIPVKEEE